MAERDEYRRVALENWSAMASGWERARTERERVAARITEWLIHELDPRPGDVVLELAAGQGDVGYEAARALGEGGRLISSDFSPAMLEIARRRSVELGVENVEHRVFDAEAIELEDDSVDGVLCRFGYMLMSDPPTALAETRRVLRRSGRLAFAVWSHAERNPWMALAVGVLARRGYMPAPQPGGPGMFVLADEQRLQALLVESGFTSVRTDEVEVRFAFGDVDDYIERSNDTGGMFSRAWSAAPDDERRAMREEMRVAFDAFSVDDGYELPGVAVCASAS